MVLGLPLIIIGGYQCLNARWEFEAAMSLQGVNPQTINQSGRKSAIRRNKTVGIVCILIGIGILVWGLFTWYAPCLHPVHPNILGKR